MYLITHLTQNLGFPCFSHLPSLFLHAFSLLQDLWWFLFVSPQLFAGWSFLCTLPCPSELSLSTNVCLLSMQRTFKSQWLCLHLSGWESPPAIFPRELFVANMSSAWLKEILMFFLHQGGSTFLGCFSLSLASYLLLSLHPQVFLSCRVWGAVCLYKVCEIKLSLPLF